MPHIEPEVGIEINGQVLRRSVFRDVFGVLLDHRQEQTHFEEVRGQWEERFERRFGFWRGFVDEQVGRYLDCGLYENGFARIRCPDCAEEYLLAFSCKTRELCPSCGSEMKVIAFIIDHAVVDKILRHLRRMDDARGRDPP